jgi:hypothetical protein
MGLDDISLWEYDDDNDDDIMMMKYFTLLTFFRLQIKIVVMV